MIRCDEIFGRSYLKSYQEFYLAMTVGAECGRIGDCLDMSMMRITDPKLLSDKDKDYLRYLKSVGSIYDGSVPEKVIERGSPEDYEENRSVFWFDVDKFTELEGRLFRHEEDGYHWSHSWAVESYGNQYLKSVTGLSLAGNLIMHLVGHMLVGFHLRRIPEKKVVFHFNRKEARSTYIYLPLYACTCSCENVKKSVELVFEENRRELRDIDYYVLYESSRNSRLFTLHDWQVKKEVMKQRGIVEGSIVAFYRRERMSKNNPAGFIKEAFIGHIERICGSRILVNELSVNKTKEEQELDYLEINEEYRHMFSDMLDFHIPKKYEWYDITSIGVCEYFYTEEWLVMPLDKSDVVNKRITINGKPVMYPLNTVEAVYWILNEFGVEFDKQLFKDMYNDGKPLMWDEVDGTPFLITDTYVEEDD